MQSLQIQWRETASQALSNEKYAHFLAVQRDGQIVEMACAYRQTIVDAFAKLNVQEGEKVFVGRVNMMGIRTLSPEMVESLFSLLLNAVKPSRNLDGKYNYSGIASIVVQNVGMIALPTHLRAEDGRVFQRLSTHLRQAS